MKIGILYICTGKYIRFFDSFFESAELHFLKGNEIHYFVFTDGNLDIFASCDRIHRIEQPKLGWPHDTLMRFHMFSRISDLLTTMDFLFFFNANMRFVEDIENDILPDESDHWLVGVIHPVFVGRDKVEFTYDNNPKSTAYIPKGEGDFYYQGCLSGGRSREYLSLSHELLRNIDIDQSKGIIALWHDESHLNRYFLNHKPKRLDPGYAYPEDWDIPFEKKIVQLDKNKKGGHAFLREIGTQQEVNPSLMKAVKSRVKLLLKKSIRYFQR